MKAKEIDDLMNSYRVSSAELAQQNRLAVESDDSDVCIRAKHEIKRLQHNIGYFIERIGQLRSEA